MPSTAHRTPSYRRHKASGQAVVTLNGRDVYLGIHGTPESRAEYDRRIAEWLAAGRHSAPKTASDEGSSSALSVDRVMLAYVRHAETYYTKNGKPTSEVGNIKLALRPLRKLYGPTPARDFGPLSLKAVRNAMIESGICRNEVNKRVRHVLRMFKWAVSNEMAPPSLHHALTTVSGLKRGRSEARETEPVKIVSDAFVDAVRPFVSPQVWTMIQLQRLTGMRPGEVCQMRSCDLDMSGKVWAYTPASHKTQHHGKTRTIYLGPQAQEIVKPWLRTELTAYLFSPHEAMATRNAARRTARKSPMTPSHRVRLKRKGKSRLPGEVYAVSAYGHAIKTACKKAGVPHWHAHRLRHNAGTQLRREFGLDVARVVLGHSSLVTTEIYAEADNEKASAAMGRIG
ncbi:MAG: site-specific tyrosine recombinase XerC [Planctomycetota bacterium]|nr:site-specific tyrosine recombinase XerC [Planctomycetota bacterium]